jgi:hypothetical protein
MIPIGNIAKKGKPTLSQTVSKGIFHKTISKDFFWYTFELEHFKTIAVFANLWTFKFSKRNFVKKHQIHKSQKVACLQIANP